MKKSRLLLYSMMLLALLLVSCQTQRQALSIVSDPVVTVEQDGLSLTLRFRDDAGLRKRFGIEANPFLTPYYTLFFKRMIVFELAVENHSSAEYLFTLSKCQMKFETSAITPTNQFHLLEYWESVDDKPPLTAKRAPLIKKYVLANERVVASGGAIFGFLVFQGNMPSHGTAQVSIPGQGGGEPFDFTFSF